jgi:hypothetical protein
MALTIQPLAVSQESAIQSPTARYQVLFFVAEPTEVVLVPCC